ncbi:MAG: hypothetical protein ACLQU1_27540 [Bryobacteraceae bacterium]
MTTKKQIRANRLNSQKSTGPRSAEGKAASSQNALKSGIDAKSQIIRGEDPAALDALVAQYLLDHQPQSATERALVDILIDSEWTLRRLRKAEAQLWQYDLAAISQENTKSYNRDNPITEDQILGRAFERRQQTFARLDRRRESLQRAYHRTLQDLREIQDSRGALWAQPAQPAAAPPEPLEAPKPAAEPPVAPPVTPSPQKPNPQNGFVPENPPTSDARPDPANPVPSPCGSPSRETPKPAQESQKKQPQTAPQPRKDAA